MRARSAQTAAAQAKRRATFPMVSPWTMMENNTMMYVMEMNSWPCMPVGMDKARATEMPPRRPPQVRMAMALRSKAVRD